MSALAAITLTSTGSMSDIAMFRHSSREGPTAAEVGLPGIGSGLLQRQTHRNKIQRYCACLIEKV